MLNRVKVVLFWLSPYVLIQIVYLTADIWVFKKLNYTYDFIPINLMLGLFIAYFFYRGFKIGALSSVIGVLYGVYIMFKTFYQENITGRMTMNGAILYFKFMFMGILTGIAIEFLLKLIGKKSFR